MKFGWNGIYVPPTNSAGKQYPAYTVSDHGIVRYQKSRNTLLKVTLSAPVFHL